MQWIKSIDWPAWIGTIIIIVGFRELAVWVTKQFNHPELGNLVGLISLLIIMSIWRITKGLPQRLVDSTNRLMKESGFAFLPICAGSLIILVQMGKDIPLLLLVLVVSTLIPLWVYAKISKKWL